MTNSALPNFFEPYRLADRQASFNGQVLVDLLPRVKEAVVAAESMTLSVEFSRDQDGYRVASGTVAGQVTLTCERCMGDMPFTLDTGFEMALVAEESQVPSLPKRYDPWLVTPGAEVSVADLLEDTILLAIPVFPKHPPEECRIQMSFGVENDDVEMSESSTPEKPNPFSILADLKASQKK